MTRHVRTQFTSALDSEWFPFLLLLFGLATVFLFGNDRGHFYRVGHHDFLSSQSMTLAANLSADHGFLMYLRETQWTDANLGYYLYNRFPIGTYALVKLTILPFENSFAAQLYAARMLMLTFFAGAVILAYFALYRITANRWVSVAATLLAFSSYYCLYYNDMISTEVTSVFGIMLTFHGMVIFLHSGRVWQLIGKSCAALLLGWHVMGLLLPFVVLGLGMELAGAYQADPRSAMIRARTVSAALLSSRYLLLGLVALLFCILVMAFNIGNEYRALNGEVSVTELPSVSSMLKRAGIDDVYFSRFQRRLDGLPFLREQIYRIGVMSIPLSVQNLGSHVTSYIYDSRLVFLTGASVLGVSILGQFFMRHNILTATLLLSGWCWALAVRGSAGIHEFEALFHIGIPLVFFSLVLTYLRKLVGRDSIIAGIAVVGLLIFVVSSFQVSSYGHDAESSELQRAIFADFEAIRRITEGKSVLVPANQTEAIIIFGRARYAVDYYLAGSVIGYADPENLPGSYDFLLERVRVDGDALLTPENRQVFLYDLDVLDELPYAQTDYQLDYQSAYQSTVSREPVTRSTFNLYLNDGTLTYVKDPCDWPDTEATFFLHIVPEDRAHLPYPRKRYGFDNLDFDFNAHGAVFDGKCLASRDLPEYDIAGIRTGQLTDKGRIWEANFTVGK